MRKASIAEAQHNLNSVLKFVEHGEEVLLTRRNKVVARIVPINSENTEEWPLFSERAKKIFGKIKGKSPGQIILEDREERF